MGKHAEKLKDMDNTHIHTHASAQARIHTERRGFLFSWQQHVCVFGRKRASREGPAIQLAVGGHGTPGNTWPPG